MHITSGMLALKIKGRNQPSSSNSGKKQRTSTHPGFQGRATATRDKAKTNQGYWLVRVEDMFPLPLA